jgi:hypothetical protein
MKKYALSDCVYAPGVVCLDCDGTVTYDPKASGSLMATLKNSYGYERVGFEELTQDLQASGIPFKGPNALPGISRLETLQMEQYAAHSANLMQQIAKRIST